MFFFQYGMNEVYYANIKQFHNYGIWNSTLTSILEYTHPEIQL